MIEEKDVMITARGGARMAVRIYRPDGGGPFPALFASSPYRYDNNMLPACPLFLWRETGPIEWYIEQGYAYVHADGRGTGLSEGEYEFLGRREQQDLYDIIEWIGTQPWSNGKVGGIGQSYYAMAQWFMGIQNPPHLDCIAPYDGLNAAAVSSRLLVQRVGRGRPVIVAPVFVLMGRQQVSGVSQADDSERAVGGCNRNLARDIFQRLRRAALVPHADQVTAGRNIWNFYFSRAIGNGVIRSLENHHDGAHFGVNIAEDIANSGTVEMHAVSGARLIKSQVESLAVKQREDIMKERIVIRKINHRADRDREHAGIKLFVLLQQAKLLPRELGLELIFPAGSAGDRRQPDHRAGVVRLVVIGARPIDNGDDAMNRNGLSPRRSHRAKRSRKKNDERHVTFRFPGFQNNTPAPKFTWSAADLPGFNWEVHSRRYSTDNSRFERAW